MGESARQCVAGDNRSARANRALFSSECSHANDDADARVSGDCHTGGEVWSAVPRLYARIGALIQFYAVFCLEILGRNPAHGRSSTSRWIFRVRLGRVDAVRTRPNTEIFSCISHGQI